eukprot:613631-Lingulodinium_polyedra.AAC.1
MIPAAGGLASSSQQDGGVKRLRSELEVDVDDENEGGRESGSDIEKDVDESALTRCSSKRIYRQSKWYPD